VRKTTELYVALLKVHLGDALMSDRQLGELLGYSQQYIAKAKGGNMSDALAVRVEDILDLEPGEVLTVARAQREQTPEVRERLLSWASKTLALMPEKAETAALVASGVRARHARESWRKRSLLQPPPGHATAAHQARRARAFFMRPSRA